MALTDTAAKNAKPDPTRPTGVKLGDAYDNAMDESFFASQQGAHRAQHLPEQGSGPHGGLVWIEG